MHISFFFLLYHLIRIKHEVKFLDGIDFKAKNCFVSIVLDMNYVKE